MICACFIVWRPRLDAQNENLVRAQIDALGDLRRLRTHVDAGLQQRPERDRGKDVHVAVQVLAVYRDQKVTRISLEGIEVSRHARIAEIKWRNTAIDFV